MYRGHKDDPLSQKGWQQMRDAVSNFSAWDAIVSSPLQRCALFAQEVANTHNIPIDLENRFMEIHWGAWEGCTVDHINRSEPGTLQAFWRNPLAHTPAGAEKVEDFKVRVLAAWQDLINKYRHQHILLVGHAGITRIVMSHTMNMPLNKIFNISVANAAVTRIHITHVDSIDHHRLLFHNGKLS